jgi:hypothetical protein
MKIIKRKTKNTRFQKTSVPHYMKYSAYIISNEASYIDCAHEFNVSEKKVRDVMNHSCKKNLPSVFYHVDKIQNKIKANKGEA